MIDVLHSTRSSGVDRDKRHETTAGMSDKATNEAAVVHKLDLIDGCIDKQLAVESIEIKSEDGSGTLSVYFLRDSKWIFLDVDY